MKVQSLTEWRQVVLNRDKVCQICGSNSNLVADHIKSTHTYPQLTLETNNGRVLCRHCHLKFGEQVPINNRPTKSMDFFGKYRMQLVHKTTIRTSIPTWLVGLMLKAKGIENITTQELTSSFRIIWHWDNSDNNAWVILEPNNKHTVAI